ncbi:MAG: Ig-like domain-containing protein [Dehalococcoidales bacterium]|nr:Ig-like domain-containing protein [Dehalococcoidales bacterium]
MKTKLTVRLKTLLFFCLSIVTLFSLSACGCNDSSQSTSTVTPAAPPNTVANSPFSDSEPPGILSITPSDNAVDIPVNSIISATFSEEMDPSSITTDVFILSQGVNKLAGMVTYSGKTAVFTPSIALETGKTYSARVNRGARDPAGNTMQNDYIWTFTTSTPLNEPVKTQSDVTPPSITSVSPQSEAEDVDIMTAIEAAFSEIMDVSTITPESMVLGSGIKGTIQFNGNTAVFTPAEPLEYGTVYTVRITTEVKDASGNAMADEYIWKFKTLPEPDITAPAVVSVTPLDGSIDMAVGTAITVTFSEVMDAGSVSTDTFYVHKGSAPVAGTVNYRDTTAVFSPAELLDWDTTYVVTLTTGLADISGNQLAENYQWSFTTMARSSGGGGGGGSSSGGSSQTRTITFSDDSLPEPPIEGMTARYAPPSAPDTGTAWIKITYGTMSWAFYIGVEDSLLWIGHVPAREGIPESMLSFYDSLGLSDFATYNEDDQKYWFHDLPPWLDIQQYDPDITELPLFVSVTSTTGSLTVKYRLNN